MRDFTLQNVGELTNAMDVATKKYVDNSGGGAFETRNWGYNAKGPLYIGGQKIGSIRNPKKDGDVTSKNLKIKTMFLFHLRELIWRVTNFPTCLFHQKVTKLLQRSMRIEWEMMSGSM